MEKELDRGERILLVDDEPVALTSLAGWLREDGRVVDTCASGREAIELSGKQDYAVCFVDLRMPSGLDGIATMAELLRIRPETKVVIMTAYAAVDSAVDAMKRGAEDYIVKPFNLNEISILVERLMQHRRIERENVYLRKKLSGQYEFQDLISKNPQMLGVFELVKEVAHQKSTVLIQGESGVGKELVARALHFSGGRADRPFVAVSCTALTETLLESELFGYEKGAFTGAVSRRPGKFELAADGTIFLDEIGEISPKLQMDLLRVLEERRFYRVGGVEETLVHARFIAATNRDLQGAVRRGDFRDDLYYRLNVIHIQIPPLRDRREDIPLLVDRFIRDLSIELGKEGVRAISEEALALLMAHGWAGNVRELRNAVERAIVSCRSGALGEEDFRFLLTPTGAEREWAPPTDLSLAEVERQVIEAVLRRTGGNVREAASVLAIDRSTLYDKMRRYGTQR